MAQLTKSTPLAETVTKGGLTYYADGTQVVMRAQGRERFGVTFGVAPAKPYDYQAVRWEDGTTDNVAPQVLHQVEVRDVVLAALTFRPGATSREVHTLSSIHMPAVSLGTVQVVLSTLVALDVVSADGEPTARRYWRR